MILSCYYSPEKLLCIHEEAERFSIYHEFKNSNDLADNVCRYDLDDLDVAWLEKYNEERVDMGKLYINLVVTRSELSLIQHLYINNEKPITTFSIKEADLKCRSGLRWSDKS